jgi:hypothetical protein
MQGHQHLVELGLDLQLQVDREEVVVLELQDHSDLQVVEVVDLEVLGELDLLLVLVLILMPAVVVAAAAVALVLEDFIILELQVLLVVLEFQEVPVLPEIQDPQDLKVHKD